MTTPGAATSVSSLTGYRCWAAFHHSVFYTQGYSGHGVNFTHVAGEIMADAVGGTLERLDLFEKIKHWRIPFGQAVGSQLVALGMLYYRLKDRL